MTFLKAFSQAYILITLIPEMISFIIRTRLSVSLADLNLKHDHPRGVILHLSQIIEQAIASSYLR